MKRRLTFASAFLTCLLLVSAVPVEALDEAERLWLVGSRAAADQLHPVARRALERFVAQFPDDKRVPEAVLLLGKSRLALGELEPALEALRRALASQPVPGAPLEAKFWEAEALFRLKRFTEARAAYDEVLRRDAASPHAPDAHYGVAWTDLELGRSEAAITAFREFVQTWPEHALAPSALFHQARALVDLKRFAEATPLLGTFIARYPNHKLLPDAKYLGGASKIASGDARGGAADLRAFVAAYPNHDQVPAARRSLTETLARHGDRDELQEAYKTLMDQTPPTPEALYDAGAVAGRLARPKDQEAAWRKLRAQFPEHPLATRVALDLASAAFKRKEYKDAASLAQAASQSTEEQVKTEALLLTGESELKLKRFGTAAKAFEAVTAVKNVEAGVRYRALAGLGLAREEQQEWKAALTAYESVASRSPDPTLRDWAKDRAAAVKTRINNKAPAPAPDKKPRSRP